MSPIDRIEALLDVLDRWRRLATYQHADPWQLLDSQDGNAALLDGTMLADADRADLAARETERASRYAAAREIVDGVTEHGQAMAGILDGLGIDPGHLLALLRHRDVRLVDVVRLDLDRARLKLAVGASPPAIPTAETPDLRPARHSGCFRSVVWYGAGYAFTAGQAAVVRVLWDAWLNGTPDVGHETLLEAAGLETKRLADVFKKSNAWGSMIVGGQTKGTSRLQQPEKKS